MRKLLFLIVLLLIESTGFSRDVVNVGLFWPRLPQGSIFSVKKGSYNLVADGRPIGTLEEGDVVQINADGGLVSLSRLGKDLGSYVRVKFVRSRWGSNFFLKSVNPSLNKRNYDDNLFVSVFNGKLKLINNVYLEHYIAGVVEAESGIRQGFEYYKVQAIICRTYALSNFNKFSQYGFNLCDNVDCQVYKGKSLRNSDIIRAVNATKGLVIVDSNIDLINAVFHSNSGGYTVNSEDAWSQPVEYLKAVPDTFSLKQPHYNWEVSIDKGKWLNYLQKKWNYPINDSLYLDYVVDYCPSSRDVFLTPLDTSILLKYIRKDWKLRSTYFKIKDQGEKILVTGKGFGHGVGLSQEGAMKMAKLGIPFNEILHFYYKDIHLIHLSALDFFRSE